MIMASRLTYGMSNLGLLPDFLGGVLPRRRTPWAAIIATTLLAISLTLMGTLASLAETMVLLLLLVFLRANMAVLVLLDDETLLLIRKRYALPNQLIDGSQALG